MSLNLCPLRDDIIDTCCVPSTSYLHFIEQYFCIFVYLLFWIYITWFRILLFMYMWLWVVWAGGKSSLPSCDYDVVLCSFLIVWKNIFKNYNIFRYDECFLNSVKRNTLYKQQQKCAMRRPSLISVSINGVNNNTMYVCMYHTHEQNRDTDPKNVLLPIIIMPCQHADSNMIVY